MSTDFATDLMNLLFDNQRVICSGVVPPPVDALADEVPA